MHGPCLEHFSLINIGLSEGVPYCGCIFFLRAVWYAAVRIAVFLVLMFLFKKHSALFAFVEIVFIWVFQLSSLLMSTPRVFGRGPQLQEHVHVTCICAELDV